MNDLKTTFSISFLKEKEEKASKILNSIQGENLEEKLENLSLICSEFGEVNDINREFGAKIKNNIVAVRTAIKRRGKSYRDILTAESRREMIFEKKLLSILEKGENLLKEKIEEFDKKKEIEMRRPLLPTLRRMLEEVGLTLDDDYILSFSEKDFNNFYAEKRQEFFEKLEEEKRKKEQEEKIKKEAIENFKKNEEEKIKKQEDQEKEQKEKLEKNIIFEKWKKENHFNEKTDFIKIVDNKAIFWRKISEINLNN